LSRKRAFTLIELLVVIAIIAILAAILFPVFAQAKQAAKKASSISNIKQFALGTIMYVNDYDDMFFKNDYTAIGTTTPFLNPDITWLFVVQPYIKNWQIFRDPGNEIDPLGVWSGSTSLYNWYYNWDRWPNYGFNTTYLNPAPGNCSEWGSQFNPGYTDFGPPITTTAVGRPSNTVMFTTTKVVGTAAIGAYTSYDSESPAGYNAPDACDWSNGGWGLGSYGDTPNWYPGNPTSTGTYSTAYAVGGNVGWVDGSVKYEKPGALAAGTNWQVGIQNSAVIITDATKYQWDAAQQ
jgi:prepilin-type N-terminal cleavage/methylation domain-containing protein/prepilin-type processing-associated H-X9-DG protein